MALSDESANLTYRERDVDNTLSDHEARIGRLEKAGLIAAGYGLAEGVGLFREVSALLF